MVRILGLKNLKLGLTLAGVFVLEAVILPSIMTQKQFTISVGFWMDILDVFLNSSPLLKPVPDLLASLWWTSLYQVSVLVT